MLLNAPDFAIASIKRKLDEREARGRAKKVRNEAAALPFRQSELLRAQLDIDAQPDQFEPDQAERAHGTHTMVKMAGSDEVLFCNVCSYWQKHKRLTAALREPCEPIKRGNWSKLRLLECGVMPGPGARLPSSMARAKGTARKPSGTTGRRCTPINPNV